MKPAGSTEPSVLHSLSEFRRSREANQTELSLLLTSSSIFSHVTRHRSVILLVWRATGSEKQRSTDRPELTLQQCPLCPGLTLYLPACSLIPCQDKPLCWVSVLVAKQSALVFNILQSACIGLAVSQGTHTLTWGLLLIPFALMREGYADYVRWGLPVIRKGRGK